MSTVATEMVVAVGAALVFSAAFHVPCGTNTVDPGLQRMLIARSVLR